MQTSIPDKRKFYDVKDKEFSVNARSFGVLSEIYRRYANNFREAGYLIADETLESEDISKLDFNFFSIAFMYRHSIELLLKAIGFQYIEDREKQKKFLKETFHNLESILLYIKNYIREEIEKDVDEYEWLLEILRDVNTIDKESDCFRYPFRIIKKGKKYDIKAFFDEQTHIDLYKFANKMEIIFLILERYYLKLGNREKEFEEFKPVFLEEGGEYYSQSVVGYRYSGGFYGSIKAYKDFSEFIYKKIILRSEQKNKLVMPLIYALRNMIELVLKEMIFEKLGYENNDALKSIIDKKHNIKKLWEVIEPRLIDELIGFSEITNENILGTRSYIEELHNIDGKADLFRYPTNRKMDIRFKKGKKMDIQNIYNFFEELMVFFEYVEYLLDYKKELHDEFVEY